MKIACVLTQRSVRIFSVCLDEEYEQWLTIDKQIFNGVILSEQFLT